MNGSTTPLLGRFRAFYHTAYGRMVRRIIKNQLWPFKGEVKAAIGYAVPYVDSEADKLPDALMMPARMGAFPWPEDGKNRTTLMNPLDWPLPSNAMDHLLVVHALEYVSEPDIFMEEVTRVLRGQGRLTLVVTNRRGPWAEADWSPFGHGVPYSARQILELLARHDFLVERFTPVLFVPPIQWGPLWRLAGICERICPFLVPAFAGVHVIEATKQLYSGITVPGQNRVTPRTVASPAGA